MCTLEDVQRVNLTLLREVDRVCRAHDITYFLDSGTLLGAVRHKGTIPWDDDADIAMTVSDYERFAALADAELAEGFSFVPPSRYGDHVFYDYIPHIVYENSRVRADDEEMRFYDGLLNHIVLDIFIIDDAPSSPARQSLQRFKLKLLYGLGWGHRYHIDYQDYAVSQKIGVWLLSHIGRLFSQRSIARAYWRCARWFEGTGSPCCFMTNYILTELDRIYRWEWFAQAVDLDYDGCRFMAPVGYHEVLTALFGDYMQLPPEDQRRPAHYDLSDPCFKIE
jgi:lipopolysaccharide cholinephosphotransferase